MSLEESVMDEVSDDEIAELGGVVVFDSIGASQRNISMKI
jgi:hypothetical protein